jgi:hypothetical protein
VGLAAELRPPRPLRSSPTPYLRQRPVNGCKLMAGGATQNPTSDQGGVASGIVCAKAF